MVNRARVIWRLGLAVGFYSWLTLVMGCAIVPGSHLTATNNSEIRTRAITSELVAKLNTPATTPIHHTELERQRLQYDYVIGPGDVLSITVWNHPDSGGVHAQPRGCGELGA